MKNIFEIEEHDEHYEYHSKSVMFKVSRNGVVVYKKVQDDGGSTLCSIIYECDTVHKAFEFYWDMEVEAEYHDIMIPLCLTEMEELRDISFGSLYPAFATEFEIDVFEDAPNDYVFQIRGEVKEGEEDEGRYVILKYTGGYWIEHDRFLDKRSFIEHIQLLQ